MRTYAYERQVATGRVVTIRQLGPDCCGGPLSFEAGRRLPRTMKTPRDPETQKTQPRPASVSAPRPHKEDRKDFAGFRDPEDPTCQERRHYPAGVEGRACHVRQPGPTCRGGSLPFKASRRLLWTK